jgi:hypothetical protein
MTSESVLQDVKQGRVKRPKVSVSFLRIVLVLHAALVVMQPIMAGYYLSGEADAMDWHSQIGSDGGLLGAPISHDSLVVAPAERFDVIIDFSAYEVGTEITLLNKLDSGPAR